MSGGGGTGHGRAADPGGRVRPRGADDPEFIGPYRVLGRIGSGGMGRIHVARSPGGRLVAVKTLLAEGAVSDADRRRFAREVSLARRVGGICTANVVDADPDAERPWLATEFIPAPSLDDLVRGCGPLPPDAVPWVAAGAAEALLTLHEAGVVHRDVKPGNILLPPDGPRVIDFGISHAVDITRTTLTLGTIAYTSPEQARGEASTAASDVYSLGATLFHLATGRPPYRDTGDTLRLLAQVSRGELDLDGLPAALSPLVTECLRDDPARRPGPGELLDELAPAVSARQGTSGGAGWLPPEWLRLIEGYEAEGRGLREGHPRPRPQQARRPGPEASPPDPRAALAQDSGASPNSTPTQDLRTRPVPEPGVTRPYTRARPAASSSSAATGTGADAGARERSGPRATAGETGSRPRAQSRPPRAGVRAHSATLRPAPAPVPPPEKKKSSSGWLVVPLIFLVVMWYLNTQSRDSSGPSTVTSVPTRAYVPAPVSSPTPDVTARAFAAVGAGDCLNAYGTGYVGQWSTELPERVDCSAAEAFVRVTSVETYGSDCPSSDGRGYWAASGHGTVLCLERQFRVGQCFPAEGAANNGVRASLLRVWNCGADTVPAGHKYVMQITAIHKGPDGRCAVNARYYTWSVYGGEAYLCVVIV
ncbi:serine/threonine protein kinase [Streptomyces poonensis]|nr:serine/threonine-protein kinase [Streptomyces poonensis]